MTIADPPSTAGSARLFSRLRPLLVAYITAIPATLAVLILVGVPLLATFLDSITRDGAISLDVYAEFVGDWFVWEVMWRTVQISAVATAVALCVGYPVALFIFLTDQAWVKRVVLLIVISPLLVSMVVRTYGWVIVLGPNGFLDWIIPGGSFGLLYSPVAIIIGLAHVYLPMVVLPINASLTKVDRRVLGAAATLGASNRRMFLDILLPQTLPGIAAASVVCFSLSMTAFATPMMLGGSSMKMVSYLIWQESLFLANPRAGGALAIVLLLFTLLVVAAISRASRPRWQQEAEQEA